MGMRSFFFPLRGDSFLIFYRHLLGEKRGIRSNDPRSDAAYLRKASLYPAYVNYVNCARGAVLKDRPIAVERSFGAGPSPLNLVIRIFAMSDLQIQTSTIDVCIIYLNNVCPTYGFLFYDDRVMFVQLDSCIR